MSEKKRCTRCAMDSSIPNITFDEHGVCNFCHQHDIWERENPVNSPKLVEMVDHIKRQGSGRRYDCIVGISGGADSSYLLHLAKKVWGLRPLAFHFDNGWNTDISKSNMKKMVEKLNVDMYTLSVDRDEFDDLCASFLKASVPDADIPNDIGMTAAYYEVADTFNIPTVLIGHSFRTEGSMPVGWTYMDGKYIESVHKKFSQKLMHTYPNLWIKDWMYWLAIRQIKVLRPFWYMNYDPNEAKAFLQAEYDWEWYKTKHGENKYTKFVGYYYLPKKFGIDKRIVRLSAPVRSGFLSRDEAITTLSHDPVVEDEIIQEVKSRLHLTNYVFDEIMRTPIKSHLDYQTYESTFHRYKPIFWLMSRTGLIPITFYKKYVQ